MKPKILHSQLFDRFTDTDRSCGCWRGRIEHMDHTWSFNHVEVIHQGTPGIQGLRAYPRAVFMHICQGHLRDKGLHGAQEGVHVQGTVELAYASPPKLPDHAPEADIGSIFERIWNGDIGQAVTFALESNHRIGTDVRHAVH